MNTRQQHGFTLWELLMTLLVAGILLGIGVPNVMEFQRNGAMTAAANNLITGVLMARTEAIKRQAPVTLCLSDNPTAVNPVCQPAPVADSTRGFIVWVDENNNVDAQGARILIDATDGNAVVDPGELVLMQSVEFTDTMRVSTTCGYVSFAPTGFLRQVGGACLPAAPVALVPDRVMLFCDDRGRRLAAGALSAARAVRIGRTGRAQVEQEQIRVDAAVVVLGILGIVPTCPP
jgi:prepilin-type N-terminal cleavage/methylation domain-containing protein